MNHAFIVGNQSYGQRFSLTRAVNDANAYVDAFRQMNWKIYTDKPLLNLDETKFIKRLEDFASKIEQGDNIVFVFSGHGTSLERDRKSRIQSNEAFLVPTGLDLLGEPTRDELVSIDFVLEKLSLASPKSITLIIDACRDNARQNYTKYPTFFPGLRDSVSFINSDRVESGQPTITIHAILSSQPGTVSYERLLDEKDGESELSLFTRILTPKLSENKKLRTIFSETLVEMYELTNTRNGRQIQTPELTASREASPLFRLPNNSSIPVNDDKRNWRNMPALCRKDRDALKQAIDIRQRDVSFDAERARSCIVQAAFNSLGLSSIENVDKELNEFSIKVIEPEQESDFQHGDGIYSLKVVRRSPDGSAKTLERKRDFNNSQQLKEIFAEHAFAKDLYWRFVVFRGRDTETLDFRIN